MEVDADTKHRYVTLGINLNAFYSRCEDECSAGPVTLINYLVTAIFIA